MNELTEVWAPVPGYEGVYDVSADGLVMRVSDEGTGAPGRILRPSFTRHGYAQVVLCRGGVRMKKSVHRLVAAAFLGPDPQRQVNHIDGDKLNNSLTNLEYVTQAQNMRHAARLGLWDGSRPVRGSHKEA